MAPKTGLTENNYAIEGSVAETGEPGLRSSLFSPAGVGAEDLEHGRLASQGLNGLLYVWVLSVAVNVYQEDVVSQGLLGGSGLHLGQVYVASGKLTQDRVENPRFILGKGEAEGGLVRARLAEPAQWAS